ncbi:MAG: hypothetical protein E7637_01820 [Ruminococcaceae bacterium]|nr:hypothetical protein [Oscillospiraceae bacterium]
MGSLVSDLFSSFSTVIEGLAGGIKTGFTHLLYTDPSAADPAFSPLVQFIFVMAGIGLATGILYKMFGLLRRRKG